MPDDLGMRIGEALERERELFALCLEVVEVGAVDAHEEVTGPPCRSNDNHGVGVVHIELTLDPDVEKERGDACLETERCTAKTHHDTLVVAVLRSAENVVDEAFAPTSKKNRWVGQGEVGFAKIELGPVLGDGKAFNQDADFLLRLFLIGSSGGTCLRRRNMNRDRHLLFGCFVYRLQKD